MEEASHTYVRTYMYFHEMKDFGAVSEMCTYSPYCTFYVLESYQVDAQLQQLGEECPDSQLPEKLYPGLHSSGPLLRQGWRFAQVEGRENQAPCLRW